MPSWVKPTTDGEWVQVSGEFYKVLSGGFPLIAGTPIELTLPNSQLLTEFSFVRMDLGDSDQAMNESLWVPRNRIAESPTNGVVLVADDITHSLYTVNVLTGATTLVGPLGIANPSAMTSHNGVVLVADATAPDSLYTVNVLTGATTLVGPLGITNPSAMTSHNGVVLVADTTVPDSLYTVNVLTGATTLVGLLGITNPSAMTSHNGVVLVADTTVPDSLYTVNVLTGATTLVGPLGILTPFGMTSHNGVVLVADDITHSLYTVNVLTGATTLVGPLGITRPSAMTSHNVGGNFFRVSNRVGLLRDGQTELIIYPQNDGYCHALLGVP